MYGQNNAICTIAQITVFLHRWYGYHSQSLVAKPNLFYPNSSVLYPNMGSIYIYYLNIATLIWLTLNMRSIQIKVAINNQYIVCQSFRVCYGKYMGLGCERLPNSDFQRVTSNRSAIFDGCLSKPISGLPIMYLRAIRGAKPEVVCLF